MVTTCYVYLNLKYGTLYARGTELWTETDNLITRCPWWTFQVRGIKQFARNNLIQGHKNNFGMESKDPLIDSQVLIFKFICTRNLQYVFHRQLVIIIITDSVVLWKIQKFDWLIPETK